MSTGRLLFKGNIESMMENHGYISTDLMFNTFEDV